MSAEEITIRTDDGRTLYWPEGNMGRLAPAAFCGIAARIVKLRELLPEFPPEVQAKLAKLVTPLPFEEALLSGKMDKVHEAIKALGEATEEPAVPVADPYAPPKRRIRFQEDD